MAQLEALNAGTYMRADGSTYTVNTTGTATVSVVGNEVTVSIQVAGAAPMVLHPQHIHAGPMCPTDAGDDANGDGFLDVIEGLPDYGPILVNLDSDLSTNAVDTFPTADATGSYIYTEASARGTIQGDIMGALKLGMRHIVIHGIDPTTPLPASVATLPGLPSQVTLPVACGELVATK